MFFRALILLCAFPSLLWADPLSGQLVWQTNDVEPGLAEHQDIQESIDGGATYTVKKTVPRTVTQTDVPLTEGQLTYLRVAAVNAQTTPDNALQSTSEPVCTTLIRQGGLQPNMNLPETESGLFTFPPPTVDLSNLQYTVDGLPVGPMIDTTLLPNGVHTVGMTVTNPDGSWAIFTDSLTITNGQIPVVLYYMDENAGTVLADSSGHSYTGMIAGAVWAVGKAGAGLAFPSVNMKVTTPVTAHALQRTYMMWVKIMGAGGNTYGRLLDKRTTGDEVEVLYIDYMSGALRFLREWSGGIGSWTVPRPGLTSWHHIAVVYDASLATNRPQIYFDGLPQVVSVASTPSGAPLLNSDPYVLGNRGAGDRWCNCVLDRFRMDNALLTQAQIQAAMQ